MGKLTIKTTVLSDDRDSARRHVTCQVRDDGHPGYLATLRFLSTGGGAERNLALASIGVSGSPMSVGKLRDLPLHRWETGARAIANFWLDTGGTVDGVVLDSDGWARAIDRTARTGELMTSLYPDVHDNGTPAGRRRFRSLHRLAEIAVQYQVLLAEGRADPAAEIARQYEVSPSTARSWVFRARSAGFLGAATGTTPGERASGGPGQLTDNEVAEVEEMIRRLPAGSPERERLAESLGDALTTSLYDAPCPACKAETHDKPRREVGSPEGSDQESRVSRR